MKCFTFKMLFSLSFTILLVYAAFAQEMITDSTNQLKKTTVFPIYMEGSGGFAMKDEHCCGSNYLTTLSIGYRINAKTAIGISKTNFQVDDEIKGFGLEYRATPTRRGIFTVEIGAIDKVLYGRNRFPTEQQYDYLPNKSQRYYFRLSAGYRFWRIFSFNVNYAQSGNTVFDYSKLLYYNGTRNAVFVERVSKQTQLLMWTLGLNLPVY